MTITSRGLSQREAYHLLSGIVVPRPIALVTSVSSQGIVNAAPFSYFNAVSSDPPMIMVAIDRRKGEMKDTTRNILATGEFVVNIVAESIGEQMNICSADYPPHVSELDMAGFTTLPSQEIAVPRIAESPAQLECRLHQHLTVGHTPNDLMIGLVMAFHIADELMESGRVNHRRLKAVGRLSGSSYCRTTDVFRMQRPRLDAGT